MSHSVSELLLNGVRLELSRSGALWWRERATLAVADLHLEKGSSFAAKGRLLPPYDSRETIARLAELIRHYRPSRVIALGDSFHDAGAAMRLPAADADRLLELTRSADWIWISGNHDPQPPLAFGGTVMPELTMGALVFRHEAVGDPAHAAGEVSGHYHPKASLAVRGRRVTGRCFVSDGERLVLPAFGAYAGGLDVLDPAIRGLFGGGAAAHVIGSERIVRLPLARLGSA